MASKRSSSKRSIVSFKDVQIAYLLDGISGVEKLVSGRKSAGTIIRKALRELKAQGRSVESLESYVGEKYGSGGRGRSMPSIGEERTYRAQAIGDPPGPAFLRLPLTPLGIKKKGTGRVRFEADRIVVTKA
jgi:hypothetical protein